MAVLLALTPKCVLCVVAVFSAGTALGGGVRELCGAATNSPATWVTTLAWLGMSGGLGTFGFLARCRRADAKRAANRSLHIGA